MQKRGKMMRCACIFDLDGTLTKTQESIARACNRTLEHFGLKPMPVENYNYYAGDGIDLALKRALADAGDPDGKYWKQGIPFCRRCFAEDPLYHVTPYPHIRESLEKLKKCGIRIAVFSNKPHEQAVAVVNAVFGEGFFDHIQGQTERIPKKPDPTGVYEILKEFGVEKENCLYFGDTNTDMLTGHNAGLYTVGVTWGFRPRSELIAYHADYLLDAADEIPELAEKFFGGKEQR